MEPIIPPRRGLLPFALLLLLPALPSSLQAASKPSAGEITRFELLGEAVVPTAAPSSSGLLDAPVGGLSALRYDPGTGTYLAVSDDGGERGPARLYRLAIDLGLGTAGGSGGARLAADGARVLGGTELLDRGGLPFTPETVDPEGLAFPPAGLRESLYISSEGRANRGIPPFVRRYSPDGRLLGELPLPHYVRPGDGVGVRHNLALESLTVTPGGRFLFTASENALIQDGPEATVGSGSPSRIFRWELGTGGEATGPPTEWVYPTDPVAEPPLDPDILQVAGVVELLALDPETLLSLERSFTAGVGTTARLFRVNLTGATEVTGRPSLVGADGPDEAPVRPAAKTLLLDLAEVLEAEEIPIDNLEGLTFGPDLPDGRRTLLLISDDNFNDHQRTQVLAFAVSEAPVSIASIQGQGHRSPFEGEWVRGVRGVVTAVLPREDPPRLVVQDGVGDDDPATAEGLEVRLREGEEAPPIGTSVAVTGRIEERGFPGALTITTLTGARLRELGEEPLPKPVVLGARGRRLPGTVIDDDGLTEYDPVPGPEREADGIDLWESLEGMRVTVPEPVVVGPTTSYGGFVLVADGGAGASLRSPVGGMVARPDDFNPERILVDTALLPEAPELWVGDHLRGPVTGVVGYSFSNFQILATEPIPPAVRGDRNAVRPPEPPASNDALTLATYNVLNLHPGVGERMDRVAATIVRELGAPDLIALQEVQDASGPADDGVVAGAPTFERLIRAIETAGGPAYSYRQIDPIDGSEGGQPGGNIRVGFLFREDRLTLPPAPLSLPAARDGAPAPGPTTEVEIRMVDGAPHLTPNPGRVAPEHPCFSAEGREDYARTRRSLAIELRFGAKSLFVIDNHWKSKRGDGRLFGAIQPPVLESEEQRVCQGRLVADFVRRLLAADPDAWVVVAGDLNEHEFRPPVQELEAAGLTDLVWRVPGSERYSYNFEGNSQILDHILVSPAVLRETVAIPTIVHVNTDRPASLAASDHDPIRVVLVPVSVPPR